MMPKATGGERAVLSRKLAPLLLFVLLVATASHASENISLMKLEEVTDLIMSPGCDYTYTLTLCPSAEAEQMREIVKDKLLRGETKEDILAYFEGVYGPKVLARPSKRGFFSLAWWFPYFLIADVFALAAVILVVWRRRARNEPSHGAGTGDESDGRLDDLFEEEVRKFKES